jgi:hypothetical protein
VLVIFKIIHSFLLFLPLRLLSLLCSLLKQPHHSNPCEHQISSDTADEDWNSLLESKVEHKAGDANKSEGHGTDTRQEATNSQAKRKIVILLMGNDSSDDSKTQERKDKATDETTVHAQAKAVHRRRCVE